MKRQTANHAKNAPEAVATKKLRELERERASAFGRVEALKKALDGDWALIAKTQTLMRRRRTALKKARKDLKRAERKLANASPPEQT